MRAKIVSWRYVDDVCLAGASFLTRFSPPGGDARRPRARRPHSLSREKVLHLTEHSLVLQWRFSFELGIAREKVALRVVEGRRNLHRDVDVMIAPSGTLQELHAFSAKTKDLIRLRAGRDA